MIPRSISQLWWRRYLSRNACSWDELDRFPLLRPDEQRRILGERLLAQIQYFGRREDAFPEWREAASIRDPADLWRVWPTLPIVTKQSLQTRFIATETRKLCGLPGRLNATGGSTGEAVQFYHDTAMVRSTMAVNFYTRLRMGWKLGMPTIIVWGSERDIRREVPRKNQINNRLLNDYLVDGYQLNDATVDAVLSIVRRRHPVAIYGFTSMLEYVARKVVERGVQCPAGHVRTAWNGGEMLFAGQNEVFRQAFGVPIHNRYGGRELSTMAFQADPAGPLNVLRPWLFAEIVDDEGKPVPPGEPGRLLWTSTICRGTPFLRFEVGDLGSSTTPLQNESGITALDQIHGRIAGILALPDGRRINNIFWNHLFKEFPEVRQFQVVVRADGALRILLQGAGFEPSREEKLGSILNPFLRGVPFDVEWVEAIPRTPQGKLVQVVREKTAAG